MEIRVESKRNYGIDLLRIVAMMMICLLHVMNHGGVYAACSSGGGIVKTATVAFLKAFAMCAVDCYAMISGYVGCQSKHRLSNILYLTFQVTFYSVLITGFFFFFNMGKSNPVSILDFAKAFFPAMYGQYWYFSAYFSMFFFIPILNVFVEKAEKKLFAKTLFAIMIVISILPTLFHCDPANTKLGITTIWLMIMYLFGAYLRKFDPLHNCSCRKKLLLSLSCILFACVAKYVMEFGVHIVLGREIGIEIFYENISPTTVICSMALVSLFANLKLNERMNAFTKLFAPVSFGVYLGHELKYMRETILLDKFAFYAEYNVFIMILLIFLTALAFWFVFSMVDKLRLMLFDALKVRALCSRIDSRINTLTDRVLKND